MDHCAYECRNNPVLFVLSNFYFLLPCSAFLRPVYILHRIGWTLEALTYLIMWCLQQWFNGRSTASLRSQLPNPSVTADTLAGHADLFIYLGREECRRMVVARSNKNWTAVKSQSKRSQIIVVTTALGIWYFYAVYYAVWVVVRPFCLLNMMIWVVNTVCCFAERVAGSQQCLYVHCDE